MKPKVLKTERDYKAALAYVERLMDQPSPDEAELDLWSRLVVNYEETHFPIATPNSLENVDSLVGWIRLEGAALSAPQLIPAATERRPPSFHEQTPVSDSR